MSDQLDDLRERVQRVDAQMSRADSAIRRLQHQSSRLRRGMYAILGGMVGLAVAAMLASPPPADTVRAPFQVVDENRQPIFVVQEDHWFGLYRAGNKPPAVLGFTNGPREFKAETEDGQTIAAIGITTRDVPALQLGYAGQTKMLNMSVIGGAPSITLTRAGGWPIATLGQSPSGQDQASAAAGSLRLADASGTVKVVAGTTPGGVGVVVVNSDKVAPGEHFRIPNTFICGGGCSGK